MAPHSRVLAEESHGQRSLVVCTPQGCRELGMTEHRAAVCMGGTSGSGIRRTLPKNSLGAIGCKHTQRKGRAVGWSERGRRVRGLIQPIKEGRSFPLLTHSQDVNESVEMNKSYSPE